MSESGTVEVGRREQEDHRVGDLAGRKRKSVEGKRGLEDSSVGRKRATRVYVLDAETCVEQMGSRERLVAGLLGPRLEPPARVRNIGL